MQLFVGQFHTTHHLCKGVNFVQFVFRQICCSASQARLHFSPSAMSRSMMFRQIPCCCVKQSGWCAPVVPNAVLFIVFFPSADSNPGAFVVFTHKFWRGAGSFSCLGAPMCFWRKNSNFAETPSLVHSVPTFNVKLISTHDLTFAPKCAQLPQVSIPSQSPHL